MRTKASTLTQGTTLFFPYCLCRPSLNEAAIVMATVCQPWTCLPINVQVSVLGVWGPCQQPMCEGSSWARFCTYFIHITRWCWGASWHWISGSNTWHFLNSSSVYTTTWHSGVLRMSCFFKGDCLTSEEELALLLILRDWNWDSPDFLLPRFSCSTLMNCNQTPSGIRDQRDQKGQLTELDQPKSLLLPRVSF